MAKILLVYEMNSPSAELTKNHYELWNKTCCGNAEFRYQKVANLSDNDIRWCDIVVLIRGLSPIESALCKKAHNMGKFCILHIDDDMMNPPDGYPMLKARKKALEYNIKNSDVVVTNPYLVDKYKPINKAHRCVTTDTVLTEDNIFGHKEGNDIIKIVYVGSSGHAHLFEEFIAPILRNMVQKSDNKLSITCVGNNPDTSATDNCIVVKKIPQMSMQKFNQYMKDENFDIGLAPVYDNEFCHGKYYNKFLNYAQFGIVGVYTDCKPYTYIVEDGINGLLCKDDSKSWEEQLVRIINDNDLRNKIRLNAYELLRNKFMPEVITKKFASDIPELNGFVSPNCKNRVMLCFDKLYYRFFKLKEYLYFFIVHLKNDGVKKTMKKVFKHFKLVKAYGELSDSKK